MMDTQFQSVLKSVETLSEREQRKLLNKLAFKFGIRAHARTAGRAITLGDDDGDYLPKTEKSDQNFVSNDSYQRKIKVITQIVDKAGWAEHGYDLVAMADQVKLLCQALTEPQLQKLNFYGLERMLRVALQSQTKTDAIAYVMTSYQNLINNVDYKQRWTLTNKLEHGEISNDEYRARLKTI